MAFAHYLTPTPSLKVENKARRLLGLPEQQITATSPLSSPFNRTISPLPTSNLKSNQISSPLSQQLQKQQSQTPQQQQQQQPQTPITPSFGFSYSTPPPMSPFGGLSSIESPPGNMFLTPSQQRTPASSYQQSPSVQPLSPTSPSKHFHTSPIESKEDLERLFRDGVSKEQLENRDRTYCKKLKKKSERN